MTAEKLYEVLGDIREDYVAAAHAPRKKKTPTWVKWTALAACVALVVSAAVPFFSPRSGPGKETVPPLRIVEYNGALYEVLDMARTDLLDRYHLPHEITADMIGCSLGRDFGNGNEWVDELFLYTPYQEIHTDTWDGTRPQRAVYVAKNGGSYSFALFCNYISFDGNTHQEASELLAVYGIDEAADIASVVFDKKIVTDPGQIEVFFNTLNTATSFGNEDYQRLIFGGLSEAEQEKLSTQLADGMVPIRLTTQAGLVTTTMHYYPIINYVYWSLNYYLIDTPLQ